MKMEKGDQTVVGNLLKKERTLGERSADNLAKWAGSWEFILSFLALLGLWIVVNVYAWVSAWDPYPFILLNLVLSCIAAIQAPIILMSQNRQSEKDRLKVDYDFKVNRKAEREIGGMQKQLNRIEARLMKK